MPKYRLAIATGIALVVALSLLSVMPLAGDDAVTAGTDRLLSRTAAVPAASGSDAADSVEDETMPTVIKEFYVAPTYPESARKAGHSGMVVLQVLVLASGRVGEEIVAVEEVEGAAELTESAIQAVRQWRFEPGTRHGEPVDMQVKIPIKFRLDSDCDDDGKNSKKKEG